MKTLQDMGLRREIGLALQQMGFENPTPIQEKVIPFLLQTNKDLMALAQTGTGKTAAFALPALEKIRPENKKLQVFVLAPTRELALQITRDFERFSSMMKGISITTVYGGASIRDQIASLKRGSQIVVATPGRAVDLMRRKALDLHSVHTLILDEADEMLNMGFKEDLDAILQQMPREKQSLLFSATMSREVEKIARQYLDNPEKIIASPENKGADTVSHEIYTLTSGGRYNTLKKLIGMETGIYGIVFCRTRRDAKNVAAMLIQDGYRADALHGDLSQAQRDAIMKRFRNKNIHILVATDVAARGLDINNLTHVIHYNLPEQTEYYTHRSGRTGRAGKTGISMVLTPGNEQRKIRNIEKASGIKFVSKQTPSTAEILNRQIIKYARKVQETIPQNALLQPLMPEISALFENFSKEEIIRLFITEKWEKHFRDYTTEKKDKNPKTRRSSHLQRMFINVGKRDKLTPAKLIGIINNLLDNGHTEIGTIEILNNFSFFEIDKNAVHRLNKNIRGKFFENRELILDTAHAKPSYAKKRKRITYSE